MAKNKTNKVAILFLENNMDDVELVVRQLRMSELQCWIDVAQDIKTFEEFLRKNDYDIIISDYYLPDLNGLKALDVLRESQKDIPFVLFTGTGNEEIAVECLKKGAADYVVKSLKHIKRLPFIVKRIIEETNVRKEKMRLEKELQESEELYRKILHNIQIGIIVFLNNSILYQNEFMKVNIRLTEENISELISKKPEVFKKDDMTYKLHFAELMRKGETLLLVSFCPVELTCK